MAKIDRLGWTAGFSFTAYGVRVGVRVNDASILPSLRAFLPPGWKPARWRVVERLYSLRIGGQKSARVRNFNLLFSDITRTVRSHDLHEVLDEFAKDLRLFIAGSARRRLFIQAGVVGWRGRAIIIPGQSLSGKSTLVAELVRAGAVYYSDEFAVLDERGLVHPFAKHPAIIRSDEQAKEKSAAKRVKPLPIGMVIVSQYRSGARWRPRSLSPGQAALALLGNMVEIRQRPEKALPLLEVILKNTPVLKSVRGEAQQVIDHILSRLPC
jgi:hypothetical protein